jgi:cell wall-associated NlpC family hydrolase
VTTERDRIGALVAQSYRQGGDLSALTAMMSADGPEAVLDQYAAYHGASTSLQADYKRFAATDALARVFESQAKQARAAQAVMAARARQARAAATAATEAAQREAAAIASSRNRLIRELARAQDISVRLAGARQTALEEIARKRAELARRAAAARSAARAEAARAEAARAEAARAEAARAADSAPRPAGGPPVVPTPDEVAPPPSQGARQAIRFAMDQLGEPYRWGAAGPGSWDCSGLTMRAWESAGRALPHYSVAQYSSGVPLAVWDLRPGDLVFWSSDGTPGGIHHVAMYLGLGQIIHAPRAGRPVEIVSMYYWVPPTFFVRV